MGLLCILQQSPSTGGQDERDLGPGHGGQPGGARIAPAGAGGLGQKLRMRRKRRRILIRRWKIVFLCESLSWPVMESRRNKHNSSQRKKKKKKKKKTPPRKKKKKKKKKKS